MNRILVIGANGQLGHCIKDAASKVADTEFLYEDRDTLDITDKTAVLAYFDKHQPNHCINAAAYTNVEKAESDQELAFAINAEGARNLAEACNKYEAVLWHISTDYVFDGSKKTPYVEADPVNPINVYGASKLAGELAVQESMIKYFVIRTSWLYSQYGHNFYKSILKFAQERDSLTITTEQTGTPTNANDLASAVLEMIASGTTNYGVYHFSNQGAATWYDFACAIVKAHGLQERVHVGKTDYYPTFAKRPEYSVMDLKKISGELANPIPNWENSLNNLVKELVS